MKKIVAIGGGENGRMLEDGTFAPYNTKEIDEEIVKLTNKENPNFLFLDHAMESLDIQNSYFETMKKIYGDIFNCNCKMLSTIDLENEELVDELIEWSDIIYEGGGDTDYMINLWKKTEFDKKLYKAWCDGKVISGISAGAVCWFNSCNSDTEVGFEICDCLNWFDYYMCPHADEYGRIESSKEYLKSLNKKGLILSNCSALEILDNTYKVLKSSNDAFVSLAYYKNGLYEQKYLEEKSDIDKL